jgi:phosphosulfolactate phosphohydrolase-like enzyme
MNAPDWRLNDAAWLATDFMQRHDGNVQEALKQSRAGRWFDENDRMDALRFVADVGASDLVPEVVDGRAVV